MQGTTVYRYFSAARSDHRIQLQTAVVKKKTKRFYILKISGSGKQIKIDRKAFEYVWKYSIKDALDFFIQYEKELIKQYEKNIEVAKGEIEIAQENVKQAEEARNDT